MNEPDLSCVTITSITEVRIEIPITRNYSKNVASKVTASP